MSHLLLTVGLDAGRHAAASAALTAALPPAGGSVPGLTLPPDPSRAELDAALMAVDGRRLVIHSDAADLARVLRRLMRRSELATTETAVLPVAAVEFLTRHGIPAEPAALPEAARIAAGAPCRTVGVLKDDSGNLVVDHAELRPWTGPRVWTRAYVDDDCLCDGEIRSLLVSRGSSGGLRATVRGRFGRSRTLSGRGLTLACDDASISSDGAGREQARRKRIWWDEPEQWRLALPV